MPKEEKIKGGRNTHSMLITVMLLLVATLVVLAAYYMFGRDSSSPQLRKAMTDIATLREQINEMDIKNTQDERALRSMQEEYEKLKEEIKKLEEEEKSLTPTGWTLVSQDNFWSDEDKLASDDYNFADLKFSYPSNWEFSCCNDTDSFSEHFVYSPSYNNDEGQPYIAIRDYSLLACPEGEGTCSLDEREELSSEELYNNLVNDLGDIETEEYNIDHIEAKGLKYTEPATKSLQYLFYTDTDVLKVIFYEQEKMGDRLVFDFLEKLELEEE